MAWSMRNAKRRWKGVKFKDTPMGRKWAKRKSLAAIRCAIEAAIAMQTISAIKAAPFDGERGGKRLEKARALAQAHVDLTLAVSGIYRRTMRGEV